jgi:hypothetical protein
MTVLALFIWVVIFVLIICVAIWLTNKFVPASYRWVVILAIIIIIILILLSMVGGFSGHIRIN